MTTAKYAALFVPDAKVQLTGVFLANTGQRTGGEGQKKWRVVECACGLCAGGCFVAVNEPHHCQADPTGYEDIPIDARPKHRHINMGNLMIVGGPLRASDYP